MTLNPSVFNVTNHASTTLANKTNHANLIADETHPHVHAREPPPHSRTRPAHPASRSRRRSPPPPPPRAARSARPDSRSRRRSPPPRAARSTRPDSRSRRRSPPPRAARSPDARPARKFHPNRCLPDPSFAGRSNHGDGSAASAAAPPRVPPTLLSLGWVQQAWRRIRSVHGRSTSGSADQGQRPDGGVAGIGAVCCFCLRSLHLSSAPPVARLLFHSDLGQTVCSHTWSASSFRRMYSCSACEVVCARQAKSDGKSQLDEVIHSKHISNLLCVGSFFCSEFVVGASLLLSTWISSWMRATRRARSPSGPATASTISRQFLFYEDSNEVPSGCCGSRCHGEDDHCMGKTTTAAAAEVDPEDGSSSYIPGSSSCPSAQMI